LVNLPNELKENFLKEAFRNRYHLNYVAHEQEIVELAFDFAFREGYFSNLPLNVNITFKNRDFRGVDLSTINLQFISFKNCALHLTGISENPSFDLKHIKSNKFDYLVLWRLIYDYEKTQKNQKIIDDLDNIFLKEKWAQRFKMLLDNSKHAEALLEFKNFQGSTALEYCASRNLDLITQLIIDNEYSTRKAPLLGKRQIMASLMKSRKPNEELILSYLNHRCFFTEDLQEFLNIAILESLNAIVEAILSKHFVSELLNKAAEGKYYHHKEMPLCLAIQENNLFAVNAILASKHCTEKTLLASNQIRDSRERQSLLKRDNHRSYPPLALALYNKSMFRAILNSQHCTENVLLQSGIFIGESILHTVVSPSKEFVYDQYNLSALLRRYPMSMEDKEDPLI
jgi:hypothetical protein